MIPLTPEQVDAETKRQESVCSLVDGLAPLKTRIEAEKARQLPPLADRGPIFANGEILEIKGGRFRVRKINHWGLVLDSLSR
jgi:hypothetical protein